MSTLEEFAEFCAELVLDNGRKMALYPEQKLMLSDYFNGVRETRILVSKKGGKTHLCAALCLYHLLVTPDAEVVVAASSRDQATILYAPVLVLAGALAALGTWEPQAPFALHYAARRHPCSPCLSRSC